MCGSCSMKRPKIHLQSVAYRLVSSRCSCHMRSRSWLHGETVLDGVLGGQDGEVAVLVFEQARLRFFSAVSAHGLLAYGGKIERGDASSSNRDGDRSRRPHERYRNDHEPNEEDCDEDYDRGVHAFFPRVARA